MRRSRCGVEDVPWLEEETGALDRAGLTATSHRRAANEADIVTVVAGEGTEGRPRAAGVKATCL